MRLAVPVDDRAGLARKHAGRHQIVPQLAVDVAVVRVVAGNEEGGLARELTIGKEIVPSYGRTADVAMRALEGNERAVLPSLEMAPRAWPHTEIVREVARN